VRIRSLGNKIGTGITGTGSGHLSMVNSPPTIPTRPLRNTPRNTSGADETTEKKDKKEKKEKEIEQTTSSKRSAKISDKSTRTRGAGATVTNAKTVGSPLGKPVSGRLQQIGSS
jgi:hypothetical protein